MKEIYDFEKFIAYNLSSWPYRYHISINVREDAIEVDMFDWGSGRVEIRPHYYTPSYGVCNSVTKERWLELREVLGVTDNTDIKLSDRVIGLKIPEWVVDGIKELENG